MAGDQGTRDQEPALISRFPGLRIPNPPPVWARVAERKRLTSIRAAVP